MDANTNNRNHRHAIIKSKSYFRNVVNEYDPKIFRTNYECVKYKIM